MLIRRRASSCEGGRVGREGSKWNHQQSGSTDRGRILFLIYLSSPCDTQTRKRQLSRLSLILDRLYSTYLFGKGGRRKRVSASYLPWRHEKSNLI